MRQSYSVSRFKDGETVRDLLGGGTVTIERTNASGVYQCIKDGDMSCIRRSTDLEKIGGRGYVIRTRITDGGIVLYLGRGGDERRALEEARVYQTEAAAMRWVLDRHAIFAEVIEVETGKRLRGHGVYARRAI